MACTLHSDCSDLWVFESSSRVLLNCAMKWLAESSKTLLDDSKTHKSESNPNGEYIYIHNKIIYFTLSALYYVAQLLTSELLNNPGGKHRFFLFWNLQVLDQSCLVSSPHIYFNSNLNFPPTFKQFNEQITWGEFLKFWATHPRSIHIHNS